MKNREMLQHLPAEVSTELSLNYLVLTLKHHKCMENKIFRVMKLALTTLFILLCRSDLRNTWNKWRNSDHD